MPENPFVSFLMGLASDGVPAELWSQLRPWLQKFATKVPERAQLRHPTYCDHVTRGGNGCEHLGVLSCRACGDTVCLKHSYVNGTADCICAQCVGAVVDAAREPPPKRKGAGKKTRKQWDAHKQRAGWAEPPPRPAADERAEALRVLGLAPGADAATIRARYRELAREHHPDRFPDAADKARAEERFKAINAAYAVLIREAA